MCATSIGSTFSHSPVPGERKSGIPDGTEIPAPVSATTEPAARTQLGELRCRAGGTGPAVTLAAVPHGLALAQEGADPLARVLGLAKTVAKPCLLGRDALVEVALGADTS